ncbi:MAG: (E)-4-hydroxy-3-methylbut-2-enyl-diphosphate synthase [Bacteroidota bacterium]
MFKTYRSAQIIIGTLPLGGQSPVRIQSMANTDTNDVEASVAQCLRMIGTGAELVRLTTQGAREAESLKIIRDRLHAAGIKVPVIADVHFNPAVAEKAAGLVDKVRINPGNYTEKRSGSDTAYSEEDYNNGLRQIRERIQPLLKLCRENNTALRIGVNHGSLSPRVMSKYGDTPEGMAESAMEFIRICHEAGFDRLVVSMKSSNTRVMVQSVRLLAKKLQQEMLSVPLHLGVTEAGDGEEGRIRSAVGIAPLLAEGFGDTIRVSLTEAPENELPAAAALRACFPKPESLPYDPLAPGSWDPFSWSPPERNLYKGLGGGKTPVVVVSGKPGSGPSDLFADTGTSRLTLSGKTPAGSLFSETLYSVDDWSTSPDARALLLSPSVPVATLETLFPRPELLILDDTGEPVTDIRFWLKNYYDAGFRAPVILRYKTPPDDALRLMIRTAGDCGALLIDGLIDGLWPDQPDRSPQESAELALNILQAARSRFSKTEYIACPSCGRTLFDIETTLKKIRQATAHLPGLKIAVMGCIVNGPGEMADADYGYVGAGRGQVTLYKGKTPVKKGVPENEAVGELISLIRHYGDWKEPIPS